MTTAAPGPLQPARGRRPSWPRRAVLASVGGTAVAMLALSACGSTTASSSAGSPVGAGSSGSASGNGQTITVAYVPSAAYEPLLVAVQDGYFTQQHIDVRLTKVSSDASAISQVAANKVQVALSGFTAGMFNAIHQGSGLKVVGSMAQEAPGAPANALVGAASPGKVTSLAGLKGEKIAVDGGAGSTGAYLVAKALAPSHVSLSQVTLVNLSPAQMAGALKAGTVAAAYMTAPYLGSAVSAGDAKVLAAEPASTGTTGVIYGSAFAGTPGAQQFFDAVAEAAGQLQGTAPSFPANLTPVAQATGQSLAALEKEPQYDFSPDLEPSTALLNDMQSVFLSSKELNYTTLVPTSGYVNGTFAVSLG